MTKGLYYKTFYGRNLRIYGWGQEPTLERSTWKMVHLGKLKPYLQTLDYNWKACQGQTL